MVNSIVECLISCEPVFLTENQVLKHREERQGTKHYVTVLDLCCRFRPTEESNVFSEVFQACIAGGYRGLLAHQSRLATPLLRKGQMGKCLVPTCLHVDISINKEQNF